MVSSDRDDRADAHELLRSPGKLAAGGGRRPSLLPRYTRKKKLASIFRNLVTCLHGELDLPDHPCTGSAVVAHDPGVRLRDIAASLDITERSAFGIIADLVKAGYVVKEKNGRRNRYHVQAHLPLPEPDGRERTVGEILALLTGADASTT